MRKLNSFVKTLTSAKIQQTNNLFKFDKIQIINLFEPFHNLTNINKYILECESQKCYNDEVKGTKAINKNKSFRLQVVTEVAHLGAVSISVFGSFDIRQNFSY